VNIYRRITSGPLDSKLDTLDAFIKRTESFEISNFYSLLNCVMELKDPSELELDVIKQFKQML
jgi:hypothetical protein